MCAATFGFRIRIHTTQSGGAHQVQLLACALLLAAAALRQLNMPCEMEPSFSWGLCVCFLVRLHRALCCMDGMQRALRQMILGSVRCCWRSGVCRGGGHCTYAGQCCGHTTYACMSAWSAHKDVSGHVKPATVVCAYL